MTERIVIHHSASTNETTIEDIHRWHLARSWIGIGYHYVIYADGTIFRGRPENAKGSHAYLNSKQDANSNGIGICLIGNFNNMIPNDKQIDSLVWLILDIWKRYPQIPVIGHKDVMATACPGSLFPWDKLFLKLSNGVSKVSLDKWMIDEGQLAIKELADKGLLHNPELWNSEAKLSESIPAYLFWIMLNRIADYKG